MLSNCSKLHLSFAVFHPNSSPVHLLSVTMHPSGTYSSICGSDNDLHRLGKGCNSDASVIKFWRFLVAICIAIVAAVAAVAYVAFARFTPVQFLATDVWSPEICTPMSVSGKIPTP